MQSIDSYLDFNQKSPKYAKLRKLLRENEQLFEWIPEETILDVGCGPGDVTVNVVLPWLPQDIRQLVGVDISAAMVNHALVTHAADKLTFATMDISMDSEILQNKKYLNQFNKVFSFFTLQWLEDLEKAVRNIHSLLTPRGQILVYFPIDHSLEKTYIKLQVSDSWSKYFKNVGWKLPPYLTGEDPLREFESMLEAAGFEVIKSNISDCIEEYDSLETIKALVESINPYISCIPVNLKPHYLNDCLHELIDLGSVNLEKKSLKQTMVLCLARKT